ncbi:MAG: ABC transporter permease [Pyrinomonadaceae bacterium]|nr:ABC transporter permease [Phycisphaerales bacterium]
MALSDFTIIRRSMTSRLFSTVTTIVTVAVAVALMLVLLSMRQAGQQAFERGAGNMHLLISRDGSAMESILNGVFYAKPPQAPMTIAEYEQISARFPLEFAVPVQQGDSYEGYPTVATDLGFFKDFRPATDAAWELAEGRLFETEFEVVAGSQAAQGAGLTIDANDKSRKHVIVLTHGSGASREGGLSLGSSAAAGSDKPAPAPHVHDEFKFKVVGIMKPTGTSHDRALFVNLNSTWILHGFDRREAEQARSGGGESKHDDHADHSDHEEDEAHDDHEHEHEHDADDHAHDDGHDHDHDHEHEALMTVADLLPQDKLITGVFARVVTRPGSDVTALLPSVFTQIRAMDRTLTVASPADQIRKLFQIVGGINQIILAIAAAVVASSGIAIMLALYNSMEQRRRQIAVLRVLGCSRPRIFGLLVTESALIGILGAIAGGICSFLAGLAIAGVLKQRLGMVITPTYALDWVLLVVVGTVLLACIAGLAPAIVAYRTPVAKNLKPAA